MRPEQTAAHLWPMNCTPAELHCTQQIALLGQSPSPLQAQPCSSCSGVDTLAACRDVVAVGSKVTSLALGDRVAMEPGVPCWGNMLPRHAQIAWL